MKKTFILLVFSVLCSKNALIAQSDSLSTESWKETPADVQKMTTRGDTTFLVIDVLYHNPKFVIGAEDPYSQEPIFLNQSKKLRTVIITSRTQFLDCFDNKPTKKGERSTWLSNMKRGIKETQKHRKESPNGEHYNSFYFNIEKGVVVSVYYPCLP